MHYNYVLQHYAKTVVKELLVRSLLIGLRKR